MAGKPPPIFLFFLLHFAFVSCVPHVGVNYGTVGDNLPPPPQVAAFLKSRTSIDRVKLFGSDPAVIQAFAGTGISVTIAAANDEIVPLSTSSGAAQWVATHVSPFVPATNISRISVGNEILATADKNLIARFLRAMRSLHDALSAVGLGRIQVSTPHSLGILSTSTPPSSGRFRRGYDRVIFRPMLEFLRSTGSPFMVNPYPYYGFKPETLNYALFRPNSGVYDPVTGHNYTNMFDGQMDAVYSAMKRLGYGDVEIVVAETGWPSDGDEGQLGVSVENAEAYNGNLIRHASSGIGTPLMPGRRFETYIFSLFNENLKPGPTIERNFGLFRPDFSPVYDVGVLIDHAGSPVSPSPVMPGPSTAGKKWCVPLGDADERTLQSNIDYACSAGVDCSPIQPGGSCFEPPSVKSHAAYAMNAYYQLAGRHDFNCDFARTGQITSANPSYGNCVYNA